MIISSLLHFSLLGFWSRFYLLILRFWFFNLLVFLKVFHTLRFDDILFRLVRIFKYVLHFRFIALLRKAKLDGDRATFKLLPVHLVDSLLCLLLRREFNECEASILVVCVVQWNTYCVDLPELLESLLQVLFANIKN